LSVSTRFQLRTNPLWLHAAPLHDARIVQEATLVISAL